MGHAAAINILKSIEKGENQYKDFHSFAPSSTVNSRIRQLEACKFIEHHLTRREKRREWYTLTKKGKRTLRIAEKLEQIFQED
ncbi:MAG: winged helix-turn-helix transcriptional regulator [Theionarchaea archaeon]|nr:winged helix-turn-helix transcriptional regulator [Theionarchaea archaeon]